MTSSSGVVLPGIDNAVATSQRGPNRSQGWLLELERAQAGLLKQEQHSEARGSARVANGDSGSFKSAAAHAPSVTQTALPQSSWHPVLPPSVVDTVAQKMSVEIPVQTQLAGIVDTRTAGAGTVTLSEINESARLTAEATPETGDALPGRQESDTAKAAFKLLRTSDESIDVVVRDPSLTLESELRLGQQVRTALSGAGARLGKVWVNGRTAFDNS